MNYAYRAFGLTIASSFPIPELSGDVSGRQPDLRIATGPLPTGPGDYRVCVEGDCAAIWVPEARAAFRVTAGREIIVDCGGVEVGRDVRLFLLGSAMAAALHQRGLLPLHACAVAFGGKAVAFLGRSGAGKSTLAAWLVQHGGRLLSDDVAVVRESDGQVGVAVGIPRLRLWRDALEARGQRAQDFPRSFEDWDKYDVPSPSQPGMDEVELAAIFQLAEGRELAFEGMSGREAVEAIAANTYRGSYVRQMGRTAEHFHQCIRLARVVPMERFERPLGFERMDADYGHLMERIRQLAG